MTHRNRTIVIAMLFAMALMAVALPAWALPPAEADADAAEEVRRIQDADAVPPVGGAPQQAQADADADDVDDDDGGEFQTDILFDTYPDADNTLRLAEQTMGRRDFPFAFRIYNSVLERWPDLLFRVDTNRYFGISQLARRRLLELSGMELGSEGVSERGAAMRLFTRARATMDEALLYELSERYFWTPQGVQAREMLGDIHLERGDAVSAVHIYYRLLRDIDMPEPARQRVYRKTVAALSTTGDSAFRIQTLRELTAADPGAAVTDGRRIVPASDLLARLEAAQADDENDFTSWTRFMGNLRRTGDNPVPPFVDVLKWRRVIVATGDGRARQAAVGNPAAQARDARLAAGGQAFAAVMPVTSGGGQQASGGVRLNSFPIIVQGLVISVEGNRIVALDVETGDLVWEVGNPFENPDPLGSDQVTPAQRNQMMRLGIPAPPGGTPPAYTLSASGGVVYALRSASEGVELLTIDAATGKRLGRVPSSSYEPGFASAGAITGGLAEYGGRIYLSYVDSGRESGRSNMYGGVLSSERRLVCIDVQDPRHPVEVWDAKLYGSMMPHRVFMQPQEPVHVPAIAGGMVYYNTDDGALLALDALTGEIVWAYAYEKYRAVRRIMHGRGAGQQPTPPDASFNATPIVHNGLVVVAPANAYSIFAFDATTGRRVWSTPRKGINYIAGLYNDLLIVHGDRIEALHWATGEVAWTAPVSGIEPAGQGTLAAGLVLVPERRKTPRGDVDRILFVDAATGAILEDRVILLEHGEDEIGNLALVEGTLISANSHRIHAFGNWETQFARLSELLQANPNDSETLFHLGGMHARRGQFDEAIDLFKKALQNVAAQTYQARPLKDVLKERLYLFHRDKTLAEATAGEHAKALATATEGLRYTLNNMQVVELRFVRARLMEALDQVAEAAFELQTIVNDAPGVAYVLDDGEEVSAGMYASLRIRRLVETKGHDAYRLVENQAQEHLASNEPDRWLRLVADYGPSHARPEALVKLAEHAQADNDSRRAGRHLARFFIDYTADPRALGKALQAIELYEQGGSLSHAAMMLKRIERSAPDATATWKGRELAGREIAELELARPELRRLLMLRGISLHAMDVPLRKVWEDASQQGFKTDSSVIFDVDGQTRVATLLGPQNRLSLFVKDLDGQTIWDHRQGNSTHFEVIDDGALIALVNNQGLTLFDSRTGAVQWSANPAQMQLIDGVQLARGAAPTGLAAYDNVFVATYPGQRRAGNTMHQVTVLVAWHLDSGKLAWVAQANGNLQRSIMSRDRTVLALVDDAVVVATMRQHNQPESGGIFAFELASGKLRARADAPGQGVLVPPVAIDETRVIVGFNDGNRGGLMAFDVEKNETVWVGRSRHSRVTVNDTIRLAGDRAILVTQQGLDAFEIETGKLSWFVNEAGQQRRVVTAVADPVAVYVLTTHHQSMLDAQVQRIELDTGKRTWSHSAANDVAAFTLTQSQDYVLFPILLPQGPVQGMGQAQGQRHMNFFMYHEAALAVIDKDTGMVAQRLDLARFNPLRNPNMNRPPLTVTVGEDATVVDVLTGTVGLSGRR